MYPANNKAIYRLTKQQTMDQQHRATQVFPIHSDTLISNCSQFPARIQSQSECLSAVDQGASLEAASPSFSSQDGTLPIRQSTTELSLSRERIYTDNGKSGEFLSDFSENLASTPLDIKDYQSQWTPPKQTLPFLKPQEPTRPWSSVLDPSLLSKPTGSTLSTPKTKPVRRIAQRHSAVMKSVDTTTDKHSPPEAVLSPSRTLRRGEPSSLAAKSATTSRLQSKDILSSKRAAPSTPMLPPSSFKRSRMVDQGTQTSGNDSSITRLIQVSKPAEVSTASPTRPVSPTQTASSDLEFFVTKYETRPISEELWECPRVFELNEEERQMIVNDFICETLESEDFLMLCQDAEKTWQRIGLGG